MKACPNCYRLYPEDGRFCPVDGSPLSPHGDVPHQPAGDDRYLGTVVAGRYETRRIVADGAMGRVYEARDVQIDRRVAMKVLHPEVSTDAVAVERFKREFEINKDLPHEHIVDVLDFQQHGQQFIMVMEFLDGEELRAVVQRERVIEPARLVRVLSQVAIGLDDAHKRQFVHRDLKPDNIFLCGSHDGDVVKLLDFGSARINKNRELSKLTSIGTTIGSPFYMSPEQAQGAENLDHRADVFAIGAIAYECLTGSVPFPGGSGPAILLAILTKNPAPVTTRAPAGTYLPPAIDDVIEDALAKKPATRTASVGAFADAFGRAFGLAGDHHEWAQMPIAKIRQSVQEASARPAAAPAGVVAQADPFAADPFAQQAAQAGASAHAGFANPQAHPQSAAVAMAPPLMTPLQMSNRMEDAFASAGGDGLGLPKRSPAVLAVAVLGALVLVALILFLVLK